MQTNPTAAMLVIGDEILSGRTRDSNMYHLAGQLTERGISLCEVRVVADDHAAIAAGVNALRAAYSFYQSGEYIPHIGVIFKYGDTYHLDIA